MNPVEPDKFAQFETLCKGCGGQLYVRGLFYVDQIPFNADGFSPVDGNVEDQEEDLEVYCTQCDFAKDLDAYVQEEQGKEKQG